MWEIPQLSLAEVKQKKLDSLKEQLNSPTHYLDAPHGQVPVYMVLGSSPELDMEYVPLYDYLRVKDRLDALEKK